MLAYCFHRESNMNALVLLNLLNDKENDKMQGLLSILSLYAMSLINSIIQMQEYKIPLFHMTLKLF